MKIVAVTACPTGIAQTYMAAARLERVAKDFGHQIKVETQGALGVENRLSEQDINDANIIIFATDIQIENRERFAGRSVVEVSLQEAIKDAKAIFKRIVR